MTMACLVLASGLSQRFGEDNKLLADLKGQALLAYCLDTAQSVSFSQRFALTSDDEPAELARARGFEIIHNLTPEDGMGASLSFGVQRILDAGYDKACILLGDMPFVTASYIQKLIKSSNRSDITYSQNQGREMPPAIFRGGALRALVQLKGDKGAQSLDLSDFEIGHTELPDEMARDIDKPNDFLV